MCKRMARAPAGGVYRAELARCAPLPRRLGRGVASGELLVAQLAENHIMLFSN